MDASIDAVNMIMRFQVRRLTAFKDPPGVVTIGYGTTVYPTGEPVRLEDTVTPSEAREYLAFDCAQFAKELSATLQGVTVSQNQFDALLSLAKNIGLGAFQESALLQKLRSNDFAGAAAEFPLLNQTVDGSMPAGGTTGPRRAAEQALFDVTPGAVPASTSNDNLVGPPDDDADPVTATRFDAAGATIVVLTDAASNVTDIVQLPNASPAAMAALLKQFPTVTTTLVAAVGAAVPPGEREVIADTPLKVPPVAKAPIFNRTPFIALGSKDGPKFPGNDVRQLQARLREIGYYTGPVTGFFDQATDEAARAFQADYFSPAEANGRVGPKTWAKLFPLIKAKKLAHKPAKKAHAKVTQAYLRLRRTPVHQDRLRVLKLEYVQNGKVVGSLDVYSGSPGHQKFRTAKDSRVGSLEPLPEGQWRVGTIMWKDGKDNYDGKIWNAGLGPVKIPLAFKAPGSTARGAIEIHIDWNRRKSPGTAGCLGLQNIHDYRILVGWLRDKPEPKRLFVNYRLGTCPKP